MYVQWQTLERNNDVSVYRFHHTRKHYFSYHFQLIGFSLIKHLLRCNTLVCTSPKHLIRVVQLWGQKQQNIREAVSRLKVYVSFVSLHTQISGINKLGVSDVYV